MQWRGQMREANHAFAPRRVGWLWLGSDTLGQCHEVGDDLRIGEGIGTHGAFGGYAHEEFFDGDLQFFAAQGAWYLGYSQNLVWNVVGRDGRAQGSLDFLL